MAYATTRLLGGSRWNKDLSSDPDFLGRASTEVLCLHSDKRRALSKNNKEVLRRQEYPLLEMTAPLACAL